MWLQLSDQRACERAWVEGLYVFVSLAHPKKQDGPLGCVDYRQLGPSLCVRIGLREDGAIESGVLAEQLRLGYCVVTRERVRDEDLHVRIHHTHDLAHLFHQVLVGLHPARRIDDDHVGMMRLCVEHAVPRDRRRVSSVALGYDLRRYSVGMLRKLLNRAGSVGVTRRDDDREIVLPKQVCEFRDRCRLSRPVYPKEEDHERLPGLLLFSRTTYDIYRRSGRQDAHYRISERLADDRPCLLGSFYLYAE